MRSKLPDGTEIRGFNGVIAQLQGIIRDRESSVSVEYDREALFALVTSARSSIKAYINSTLGSLRAAVLRHSL
jgi:hypothetical protein